MSSSLWTSEFTLFSIIALIIGSVIGYLIATTKQSKQNNLLAAELQQQQQALLLATSQHKQLQDEAKQLEQQLHQKELQEGKLQAHLINFQQTEKRLSAELSESKNELTTHRQALDQSRLQRHHVEKQLEAAQADYRAQFDQLDDLRERLATSQEELRQERQAAINLRTQLAEEGKKAQALATANEEAREQLAALKTELQHQATQFSLLQDRYQQLSNDHTELKTSLTAKEDHFKEQMLQLSETRTSLTKEFENLANKIFEEKGKTFSQTSQVGIDSLLKPFREQIEGFQKRINEVHDASIQGNTSLNAEIKKVLDIGLQMSKEATNLTTALKGDSQQRGAWGEAQLRRTLEMSGLIEDAHYEVQSAFKDAEGKQKQTDYLIKLPDGKHIIIDSKVSLNAYDRAISASTPEDYQIALSEHVRAVRKHIDDLAGKDYTNLVGMRSPSFVLMFMPIEPAYIEALKHNKDLFEYGYKKGIVLVSHTTLIPILRTVSNLWMIERSNTEAREISEKAGDIYNQVCLVAERLSKLGNTLNTVSNHYNSTVTALAGQQGLYGKVERFNQLSTKISKSLPMLEPAHMDFESERLALIVEPIDEPLVSIASEDAPSS